jgi:hypothetical protein
MWLFGGCCRQDLLMKPLRNSIDVQNAVIPGEIILKNNFFDMQLEFIDDCCFS